MQSQSQLSLNQLHENFVKSMVQIYCTTQDEELVAQHSIHDDKRRFLPYQPIFALLNRYAQKKGYYRVDQLNCSKGANEKDIAAYRLMRIIFDCHFLGAQPAHTMFLKDYLSLFSRYLVGIQTNAKAIASSQSPSLSAVAKHMAIYLNVILTVANTQQVKFEFLGDNRLALFRHFDALAGGDADRGSCWQSLFNYLYKKFQSASASRANEIILVEVQYFSLASLYSDPFQPYKAKIEAYDLKFASDGDAVDLMLSLVDKVANHIELVIQEFGEKNGADDVIWAPVSFEVMSLLYLLDKAIGLFEQRSEQQTYGSHLVAVKQFATGLKELIAFIHEHEKAKSLDGFWGDDSAYLLSIASIKAALFSYLQLPVNLTSRLRQEYAASLDSYYASILDFLSEVRTAVNDAAQDSLVLSRFISHVEVPLIGIVGGERELKEKGVVHMMQGPDYEAPNFRQYKDIYEALVVTMSCFASAIDSWQVACDCSAVINQAVLDKIVTIRLLHKELDAKLSNIRDAFNAFRKADHKQPFEEVAGSLQDSSDRSSGSAEVALQASHREEGAVESGQESTKLKASPELPAVVQLKQVNLSFFKRYPKAMKPLESGSPERSMVSALVRAVTPGSAARSKVSGPATVHLGHSPSRAANVPPPPLPFGVTTGGASLMHFGANGSSVLGSPTKTKGKSVVPPGGGNG